MDRPHMRGHLHWLALGLLGLWPFVSFLDHNRDDALVYWQGIAQFGAAFVAGLYVVAWIATMASGRQRSGQITATLGVGAVCLFN